LASFISLLVNDEQWEVRRFSGDYYHRRPGRSVWLPGVPPDSSIEEIENAYARLVATAGKEPPSDKAHDEGRPR
jgi:hypothetical protein